MLDDPLEHIYNISIRTQNVVRGTCRKRWMIGTNGGRESGKSMFAARYDDIYIYIQRECVCVCVCVCVRERERERGRMPSFKHFWLKKTNTLPILSLIHSGLLISNLIFEWNVFRKKKKTNNVQVSTVTMELSLEERLRKYQMQWRFINIYKRARKRSEMEI